MSMQPNFKWREEHWRNHTCPRCGDETIDKKTRHIDRDHYEKSISCNCGFETKTTVKYRRGW